MFRTLRSLHSRRTGFSRVSSRLLHFLLGAPSASPVPPGSCILTEDFTSLPLLSKQQVNHDTNVYTFATLATNQPLNLSTCACILAATTTNDETIVRPYTPISTNAQLGSFDLLVKHYPEGQLSAAFNALQVGETMDFKHIAFNVKIQYPFEKKHITMIAGGTGITPMIQALHAILGTKEDDTTVHLLYGSKSQDDIIAGEQIEEWAANSNGRLVVTHVLSNEPADSDWTGEVGYIDERILPAPSLDSVVFICGPDQMYQKLSGGRTEEQVTGVLGKMGYTSEQVVKF